MNRTIQGILKEDYKKWKDREYIFTRVDDIYKAKTFGQTIYDVLAFAEVLLSFGLQNENIAVYGENSYEWMVSDLAIMGYVGANVAIDKEWKEYSVDDAIRRTNVKCVIYSKGKKDIIGNLKPKYDIIYIYMQEDFAELLAKGYQLLKNKQDIFDFDEREYDKMCKIVFSSGTTGIPKASMLTQRNILCGWDNLYKRAPMIDTDICYLFLPLHHTYAGLCNFLFSTISGMQIYLCSDTRKMGEELQIVKPTVFCAVPLIYERFYKIAVLTGQDLKTLFGGNIKYMFSGGAYFDEDIRSEYKKSGLNMMEAYALSETSSIFSIQYSNSINVKSVGTIFENIVVKVINPDENGCGELAVKGDNVCLGYYGNEKATKEAFDKDGYFHTGDLGYIDENNELYLTGRKKRMILTGNGENVDPKEIEHLIHQNAEIAKVKVYEDGGIIKATIYVWDDVDLNSVIENVNKLLPKYKQVKEFNMIRDSIDTRLK
ncbi:AMP-binding protein [Pseudobacteroides cellulosolvens]|uniref:Long-chain-fatty-acid--CoA ligase n=1 Tax=Pseudobacteroides cellulosolvens ATCC 35603 = DSM 2933 TaxID=398512 RepID=A0A0L6JR62_9FIRM|nr:AMP-binding protein [Pseudobacteroides cellulosolvens]KNY27872.1 Long-chain-fatty-acid--CoA ligase [Pseudobacteroides cellulosolvens ATCC 35603 = DSM 2933]